MVLVESVAERTTAATDAVLALAAFVAILVLRRMPPSFGRSVWLAALLALVVGATLGAIAHGLALPARTRELLWQPYRCPAASKARPLMRPVQRRNSLTSPLCGS